MIWTRRDELTLTNKWESGISLEQIAVEFGISVMAVKCRAWKVGLRKQRSKIGWWETRPDQLAILKRMWKAGASASRIATVVGSTKNAVLGRIRRDSLHRSTKPKITIPVTLKQMIDLKPMDCRYPYGDPGKEGFGFCGKPVTTGRPYCQEHLAICTFKAPKLERLEAV